MFFLIALLVVLAIVYLIYTYNQFQSLKTRIKASIQEIGNQLKRQAELIPNLVESTKGYLKHEKGIYEQITEARKQINEAVSSGEAKKMLGAQESVQKLLGSLRIIVESNPEIKGSEVVGKLMNELRDTADKVMYARRTLIDLVADYNRMIITIPSNLVAKIFGFKQEEGLITESRGKHLRVSEEESASPKVNLS
jgi:LemA protein